MFFREKQDYIRHHLSKAIAQLQLWRKKINRIYLSPPHLSGTEQNLVHEAFASNYIAPTGPMVDVFERELAEYTKIRYCVAVSSGTAAMHLALRCLGVGPSDQVFASTLTFIGGVAPIIYQGAKPVFIDCEEQSWNMDPVLLDAELRRCEKLGRLPKVVVPTDLYGQCSNYQHILNTCAHFSIPVVVDAAEALGARWSGAERTGNCTLSQSDGWMHAGKGAVASVFSFNGNKIITTSGGGMLASDNRELVDHARFLSQQAKDPAPHYEHSTIGYNYRMSNIVAAIGRGQLPGLEQRVQRKREIFDYYRQALEDLPGIEFMPEAPWSRGNRWLTVILIDPKEFGADREAVRLALESNNIESRPVWKPMHLQPVFKVSERCTFKCEERTRGRQLNYPARVVGGKVAERLFERGLCLPSGTALTEEDLNRIVNTIRSLRT